MSPTQTLLTKPFVGHNSYEVLRRKWLKHGNKELQRVLVRSKLAFEQEVFMMEDNFTVNIFHKNPHRLRRPMNFLVPLEIWRDYQLYTQRRSGKKCTENSITMRGKLKQ